MKKVSLFLLILLFNFCVFNCSNLELTEAHRQYSAGDYENSVRYSNQAINQDPSNADAWYLLGQAYGKLQQFKRMKEAFSEALNLDPDMQYKIRRIIDSYTKEYYEQAKNSYSEFNVLPDAAKQDRKQLLLQSIEYIENARAVNSSFAPAKRLQERIFSDPYYNFDDLQIQSANSKKSHNLKPTIIKPNRTLAILDLEGISISQTDVMALTNRLYYQVFVLDKFILLERNKISEILKEQSFQMSGCTTTECMVEAGKLLSVHYMLGGTISKIGKLYSMDLRLIDVESGRITSVAKIDVENDISYVMQYGLERIINDLLGS